MIDIDERYSARERTVLEFINTMQGVVTDPGRDELSGERWSSLARLVATEQFVRVAGDSDAMTWTDYIAYLGKWARTVTGWDCSLVSVVSDSGNDAVHLHLSERVSVGTASTAVHSESTYEFDHTDRICRVVVRIHSRHAEQT